MPFFRKKPLSVEAYRMPLPGKQPSDGLVFFLQAHGLSVDEVKAQPGDWVIVDSLLAVSTCRADVFDILYERA